MIKKIKKAHNFVCYHRIYCIELATGFGEVLIAGVAQLVEQLICNQ